MQRLIPLLLVFLLGTLAQAQCGNPFYPVGEGWTWTYKNSTSGKTHTITTKEVSSKGFTQSYDFGTLAFDNHWVCTGKGMMQPEFRTNESGSANNLKLEVKTLKASGVVFPPSMREGTSWSYSYDTESKANSTKLKMTLTSTQTVTSKIVGQESVKVAAGKYRAVKVESTYTTKGTMDMGGKSVPMNTTFKSTAWYAEGVGLVKSVSQAGTTELISLKK